MSGVITKLSELSTKIVDTYEEYGGINRIDSENFPSRENVVSILEDLFSVIFPGYFGDPVPSRDNIPLYVDTLLNSIYIRLSDEIAKSFRCFSEKGDPRKDCEKTAAKFALALLGKIPKVRQLLNMDIQAAYDGDPAAKNRAEIITCYPCTIAISTYRIAHELYLMDIPLIPRIMGEWAHSGTGIDIHPGAKIGERFFVDHGTGVVIGETTQIGNDVKIYQGVTLGALSFPKDECGKIKKGGKRHPTIEDEVVIYSGATILGGDTIIGKGSVIGASAWVISSVPPGTKVMIAVSQENK